MARRLGRGVSSVVEEEVGEASVSARLGAVVFVSALSHDDCEAAGHAEKYS